MNKTRTHFLFLNLAHAYDHLFMLLFPTAVLGMGAAFQSSYSELLALAVFGFVAFGAGALPSGWLGDRWSRKGMMAVFFIGIGGASILTGLSSGPLLLAAGLTLIGLFASIYHPVGIAMVVQGSHRVGRDLGINGVCGNLGIAAAALVAGTLTDFISWRAAFILPGIVAMLTGLAYVVLARRPGAAGARQAPAPVIRLQRSEQFRVFGVIAFATTCGGLIFNSTTVSLPKVFEDGMAGLVEGAFGVGTVVSMVFVGAAFAQIVVGYLIDHYPLKRVFTVVATLQVPVLLLVGISNQLALLASGFAMMLLVFGQIPILDTLVARHTPDEWRSRIYAVKYVLSLGISAAAVPMVAVLYSGGQGFGTLFGILAAFAAVITVSAALLPMVRQVAVSGAE